MGNIGNKLYAEDGKLENLSRLRKAGIYLLVGGIAAFVICILLFLLNDQFYFTDEDMLGYAVLISMAVTGIGALLKSITDKKAKKVAVNYTPEALKRVFDRLDEYDHKKGVSDSYIRSASGSLPSFDMITDQKDYVKGVLRGIPVEFSEFTLKQKQEERDEDGEIKETYSVAYKGVILIARHGLKLKQDIAFSQSAGELFGRRETESIDFNKLFHIRAGDDHEIFYVLTPQYMEKLVQLSNDKGKIFGITLLQGGELLLTLKGRNYFEAAGTSDVEALMQKIADEMNDLGDILERLEVPREDSPYPMGKQV